MNSKLASLNAALTAARDVLRVPQLAAWAIFIVFFPIYVMPNGLPQPASFLFTLLMPSVLAGWDGRISRSGAVALRALLWFVLYAVAANLVWSVLTARFSINLKEGFLLSPLFYIYNGLLLLTILVLHRRFGDRFLWLTTRAVLVSVAVQVVYSFFTMTRMRAHLGFNEPNQLGAYSLLSAGILLLCAKRAKLTTLHLGLGLIACSYLALLSASKAALGSIAMLGIAVLLASRIRTALFAMLLLVALLFTPNAFSAALERAEHRIENDDHLGFFEERGYDRIVNNPKYWFLGSGEGAYRRFKQTTAIGAHELHSSVGTLFFCYGIVGFSLFGFFLWRVLRPARLLSWLVVGPAFAYGMTHLGLRFSMTWVLLGIVMCLTESAMPPPPRAQPTPVTP